MPTVNLSISSFSKISNGSLECEVESVFPQYIAHLTITPIGPVSGRVNPGTRAQGGLRTIYLPPAHSVFQKAYPPSSPFTLLVTHDGFSTYNVTAVADPVPLLAAKSALLSDELKKEVASWELNKQIDFLNEVHVLISALALAQDPDAQQQDAAAE